MVELLMSKIKADIALNESAIQILKPLFVKEEFKANEIILSGLFEFLKVLNNFV